MSSLFTHPQNQAIVNSSGIEYKSISGEFEIPIEDIEEMSLRELSELSMKLLEARQELETIWICADEEFTRSPGSLAIDTRRDGRVTFEFGFNYPVPYSHREIRTIANSHLPKIGGVLTRADFDPEVGGAWSLAATATELDFTVKQLRQCQLAMARKIVPPDSAHAPGSTGYGTAELDPVGLLLGNLRSGNPEILLGERERSWLEFKQSAELDSNLRKIKMAQHVARFANSESGGLLILGVKTNKVGGYDTATELTPLVSGTEKSRKIEDVINSRIYPQIRGLEIEVLPTPKEGSLILVTIPSQMESEKPFLVHGAIVDDKEQGSFFSIVRRRDEGSVPITAREVHAFLAAGYNLMRKAKGLD